MKYHQIREKNSTLTDLDRVNLLREFRKTVKLLEMAQKQVQTLSSELMSRGVFDDDATK